MRDLKKLKPAILEALLSSFDFAAQNSVGQDLTIHQLEQMSDEELFVAYCDWHGLINWGTILLDTLKSIRESRTSQIWCYYSAPITTSLLEVLNKLPYNAEFVTIQNGQVVYRCNT